MSDGMTDDSRRDRMLQRKMENLRKKLGPGPHFGGLITDPIPGRLRALEERVSKIESVLFDPDYVQIVTTCDEMEE